MEKIFFVLIFGLLWLSACGQPPEGTYFEQEPKQCREHGLIRSCTAKESAMIDDIVFIINQIKTYRPKQKSFIIDANSESPRVLLFGERHDAIMAKIKTLATINAMARPGDFGFFEGLDRKYSIRGNCPFFLIFELFLEWQAVKQGLGYYSGNSTRVEEKERYSQLLPATSHYYDFSSLNLNVLRCGFWDDEEGIKAIKEEEQKALPGEDIFDNNEKVFLAGIARNKGLNQAIDYGLRYGNRVFINAGILHLPFGERLWYSRFANLRDDYPSFYAKIDERKRLGPGRIALTAGTTKLIYDHLTAKNIPYAQLIHRRMLRGTALESYGR